MIDQVEERQRITTENPLLYMKNRYVEISGGEQKMGVL